MLSQVTTFDWWSSDHRARLGQAAGVWVLMSLLPLLLMVEWPGWARGVAIVATVLGNIVAVHATDAKASAAEFFVSSGGVVVLVAIVAAATGTEIEIGNAVAGLGVGRIALVA